MPPKELRQGGKARRPSARRERTGCPRDETSFFGREAELTEITRRLGGGARLVTIVGLGGIGKTRLAIRAATAPTTKGAVAFAALGNARSLEAAVREIALATAVRLRAEQKANAALGALAAALNEQGPMLLVLDNLEQLGDAARALVSALLDGAR